MYSSLNNSTFVYVEISKIKYLLSTFTRKSMLTLDLEEELVNDALSKI